RCVDTIITEMGVMRVTPEGLVLGEINPEFTPKQVQEATDAELIISPRLKSML
ncbi:MAG: succinyl-CoA--3-ketoacid-CoA transferase, partial [Oscillospiraceae bacterium]|nr:succinyl-CoA--3-ketoacid-CoA transferase [Oscillospiraceae bacterium]